MDPTCDSAFCNWGVALSELGKIKNDKNLLLEALEKYKVAFELNGECYNLACGYALIGDKVNSLIYLELCAKNKEVVFEFAEEDEDFAVLKEDEDFKLLIEKYK